MKLAAWAERNGVARVTVCRWFRAGLFAGSCLAGGSADLVDVGDMSEIVTSMCAGLYGKRAAQNRAGRALAAAASDGAEAV